MTAGFWFSLLAFVANLVLLIILLVRYYQQQSDAERDRGGADGPAA